MWFLPFLGIIIGPKSSHEEYTPVDFKNGSVTINFGNFQVTHPGIKRFQKGQHLGQGYGLVIHHESTVSH